MRWGKEMVKWYNYEPEKAKHTTCEKNKWQGLQCTKREVKDDKSHNIKNERLNLDR